MNRFFSFLSITFIVTVSLLFTSCKKATPSDPKPVMTFRTATGFTSSDATLPVGGQFKVDIITSASAATGAKLTNLKIVRIFNNKSETVVDSSFFVPYFNAEITSYTRSVVGQEKWTYTLTSADNEVNEKSITITTQFIFEPINEYSSIIIGAQKNSNGNAFSSKNGTIYSMADAKSNSAKIDWLYLNDSTNLATIAAPIDPAVALIYNDSTSGVGTWSVKNSTTFKKVTDPVNWPSITNDSVIISETYSGINFSKIAALAKYDILSFVTASGKRGLIRIDDISGTVAGQITISVKVQKTTK